MSPKRFCDLGFVGHRAGAQRGTGDGQSFAQNQAHIDRAFGTTLHRDDGQAAVFSQALNFARNVVSGHHVQHHIDAAVEG